MQVYSVILRSMIAGVVVVLFGLSSAPAEAKKRVAFIVGIGDYLGPAALRNPANDATDIAAKLKTLGFDVELALDIGKTELDARMSQWQLAAGPEDTALFYYSGHGVTFEGESYLIPRDFPALDLSTGENLSENQLTTDLRSLLRSRAVRLSSVLESMALGGSKSGLAFIDACRNVPGSDANPVVRGVRSVPTSFMRGLASLKMDPRASRNFAGILRIYATDPDNVASDGAGRNSPFTKALLANIDRRGESIYEVLNKVTASVRKETNDGQIPWFEGSPSETFYFVPPEGLAGLVPGDDDAVIPSNPDEKPRLPGKVRPGKSKPVDQPAKSKPTKEKQKVAASSSGKSKAKQTTVKKAANSKKSSGRSSKGVGAPSLPPGAIGVGIGG